MESRNNKFRTTFPVSSGLLEEKHVLAMGNSIWCFLWCIDRTTRDQHEAADCWGQVLGGGVVTLERIARELGFTQRTVRNQLGRLQQHGYIRLTRFSRGQRIEVAHSIKWRRTTRNNISARRADVPEILTVPQHSVQCGEPPKKAERPFTGSLADELRKRLEEREKTVGAESADAKGADGHATAESRS